MMGLDAFGPLLIVLALALMTVCPLHVTISRPRTNRPQAVLVLRQVYPTPAAAPDPDHLAAQAEEALAADTVLAGIAETYDQA